MSPQVISRKNAFKLTSLNNSINARYAWTFAAWIYARKKISLNCGGVLTTLKKQERMKPRHRLVGTQYLAHRRAHSAWRESMSRWAEKKNNKEAKATKHANDLLLARTWLQACVGRSVQLERHSKLKSSPDSTEPCLGTRDQYSARDRGARSLSNTVTRHLLGFDATRRVWPQRWARPCWAARASRLAKRCRTRGRRERAPVDRRRALLRRPTSDGGSDCGLSFAAPVLEPVPLLRTNAM